MRLPRKPTQLLTTQLLITAEKSLNLYLIVLVLDQRFRQNSSVSFVNTNVTRGFRDANVSALVFDLSTNTYNLYGDFKYNNQRPSGL
jgi:hypothetical protein